MPHLKFTDGSPKYNNGFYTKDAASVWLYKLQQKPRWRKAKVYIYNYDYSGHFADLRLGNKTWQCHNLDYNKT